MEELEKYSEGAYCKFFGSFAKIYTLADDKGNVFYVGCTVSPLELRIAQHISEAKANKKMGNKKKNDVIKSLDYKVTVKIVDMMWVTARKAVDTMAKTKALEEMWIVKFHELGYDLCNLRAIRKLYPKKANKPEYIGQTFKTQITKDQIRIDESKVKEPVK